MNSPRCFTEMLDPHITKERDQGFNSPLDEEISSLDWAPVQRNPIIYDNACIGLAFIVFHEYFRATVQNGFDFMSRRAFVFMNWHAHPTEAMTFTAHQ